MITSIRFSLILSDSFECRPAKKRAKILDGTFYQVITEHDGRITAACTECKEVRKGSDSSTGNFKSHYKAKHSDRAKDLEKYLKEPDASVKFKSNLKQQSLTEVLSPASSENVSRIIFYDFFKSFYFQDESSN